MPGITQLLSGWYKVATRSARHVRELSNVWPAVPKNGTHGSVYAPIIPSAQPDDWWYRDLWHCCVVFFGSKRDLAVAGELDLELMFATIDDIGSAEEEISMEYFP